jgi:hypothetical protein
MPRGEGPASLSDKKDGTQAINCLHFVLEQVENLPAALQIVNSMRHYSVKFHPFPWFRNIYIRRPRVNKYHYI